MLNTKPILTILLIALLLPIASPAAQTKGIKSVPITDSKGNQVGLYTGSHALLIGVSDYTAGWSDLQCVPDELNQVETALKGHGFNVEKVMNPKSGQLEKAFKDFIGRYGYDENNRLVFFFSGHGYSRKRGRKGYLVPTDAPLPTKDKRGFLQKALTMTQILTWAKDLEAKHALFLFDSCFSGTIFKTKSLPKAPPHISAITSRPVRQFISAGDAGELVPARSVFVPSFIRALRGEGDLSGDGYVTGSELGMHLRDKVIGYETGQTPQYGKIRDPDLDEGDFVFVVREVVGIEALPGRRLPDAHVSRTDRTRGPVQTVDRSSASGRIILPNGRTIKGEVVKVSDSDVVVRTSQGLITFAAEDVQKVIWGVRDLKSRIASAKKQGHLEDAVRLGRLNSEDTDIAAEARKEPSPGKDYYFIQGAVRRPGRYVFSERSDVLRAIAQAGGLASDARA